MLLEQLEAASAEQGAAVATLKQQKADKAAVDAAVAVLLQRKAALKEALDAALVTVKASGDVEAVAKLEEKIAKVTPRPPTHTQLKKDAAAAALAKKRNKEGGKSVGNGVTSAVPTVETREISTAPLDVTPLLEALRSIDAGAALVPNETPRYCNGLVACLCGHHAVLHGHRINIGHASLDKLGAATVCARIAATKCSCCRGLRKVSKHKQNEKRECFTCGASGHLVRDCPQSRCSYCGGLGHLARDCTFGTGTSRSQSFMPCGDGCFVRRLVVPLHRARTDFGATDDPREGRIDLAARLVTASLVASQRLRHNTQLWLPFLGNAPPSTLCVTGGTVRGLHPAERDTVRRFRHAIDSLRGAGDGAEAGGGGGAGGGSGGTGEEGGKEEGGGEEDGEDAEDDDDDDDEEEEDGEGGRRCRGARPHPDRSVRGFRLMEGAGLEAALREALTLAREGGTAAPLLILEQGAPPLADVLQGACFSAAALRDLVVVLGDDIGLSEEESAMARRVGAEAAGGGPVLGASFGTGALLASHCIVLLHHYLDGRHDCPPQLWAGPSEEVHKIRRQQRSRRTRRSTRGEAVAIVEGV